MDFFDIAAKYGPQVLPVLTSILVIVFTKQYVYKGMVPESMLSGQMERETSFLKEQADREQKRLTEQADRDRQVLEAAKDLEQNLEEIVFQLQSLTQKVSAEVSENNARITSLERYLSDQMGEMNDLTKSIQHLAFQCERHRKGIPETQVFLQERNSSS